jgi:hypothetical protein
VGPRHDRQRGSPVSPQRRRLHRPALTRALGSAQAVGAASPPDRSGCTSNVKVEVERLRISAALLLNCPSRS